MNKTEGSTSGRGRADRNRQQSRASAGRQFGDTPVMGFEYPGYGIYLLPGLVRNRRSLQIMVCGKDRHRTPTPDQARSDRNTGTSRSITRPPCFPACTALGGRGAGYAGGGVRLQVRVQPHRALPRPTRQARSTIPSTNSTVAHEPSETPGSPFSILFNVVRLMEARSAMAATGIRRRRASRMSCPSFRTALSTASGSADDGSRAFLDIFTSIYTDCKQFNVQDTEH